MAYKKIKRRYGLQTHTITHNFKIIVKDTNVIRIKKERHFKKYCKVQYSMIVVCRGVKMDRLDSTYIIAAIVLVSLVLIIIEFIFGD